MDNNKNLLNYLKYIAIFGNIIYILWIIYNGIDEGFKAGSVQIVSFIGIILLLILNIFLLLSKPHK